MKVGSCVCFVKFEDPASVGIAQHLTNTVFIDRALIVVPVSDGKKQVHMNRLITNKQW